MHVIVLGAGVIGTTTALALVEKGLEVTLVDQAAEVAAATSHANGGGMTPGHAEPWNPPGTLRRLLSSLGSNDKPYRIDARALPGLLGWGMQFLANSRPARYYENARRSARLAVYSGDCLKRLRQRHDLQYQQVLGGSLELYFSADELEQAIELRRRINHPGIELRRLRVDETIAMEPALAPVGHEFHAALLFPRHESGDARVFSQQVAERAVGLGARLVSSTTVARIKCSSGRFTGLETSRGEINADACVVAAGCNSTELLEPLGLKLPIYPVKGYSTTIELADDDPAPTMPVLDLRRRFVTARLGRNHLRIAGLADFAGHDMEIHRQRLKVLLEGAAQLLPRLRDRIMNAPGEPWTGLRPMTPDGPPLLGATPIAGLYLNTGHGAMGWTQAAGSAELVADLVAGRKPHIDLTGLQASRYFKTRA
ncbi:MAG: D-amino acid dehydrogenase [Wenzhouxiangellaceae bacterium]|nr:D-amino acid dehydrogenase [Wenzhouxiangellaceae bacterium]